MGNKIGTVEYEDNEGRLHRIAMYRQFANLDEDFEITEDNVDNFTLNKVSCYCNRPKDKVRAELLGKEWLGENWDEI